ncbi:MAG: hypothetical protein IKR19_07830 [Acholeplasmatales bacterium]|nr:hypothetical protein [Acholeplasmatales bacterium]
MDKLLASINTRLTYIENHTENAFILNICRIIREKLVDIKNRKYTSQSTINDICDRIINSDINKMQRVSGEAKLVYTKMSELAAFIEQIKEKYFEEDGFDYEDGGLDE